LSDPNPVSGIECTPFAFAVFHQQDMPPKNAVNVVVVIVGKTLNFGRIHFLTQCSRKHVQQLLKNVTRNARQSLAYSPLNAVVSPVATSPSRCVNGSPRFDLAECDSVSRFK